MFHSLLLFPRIAHTDPLLTFTLFRGLVVYPSGYTLGFYAPGPWAPWEGPGVPISPWVWALEGPGPPWALGGPVGPKGIPEGYTTFR